MRLLQQVDMLPREAVMDTTSWQYIREYYLTESPVSLNSPATQLEDKDMQLFQASSFPVPREMADVSLVEIDNTQGLLFYGGASMEGLFRVDLRTGDADSLHLDGAPADIISDSSALFVLTMGNIHPNNMRLGKVYELSGLTPSEVIDDLTRPVHISRSDLNGDGRPDLVVSGFGYLKGDLSWFENQPDGYTKHILRDLPGAIKTEVLDFNNDGNADILALMAQGDEGFFFFAGDGKGNFSMEKLISFPPSYGSSYFEMADMNNDGLEDIIYVNGDNGDYPAPVLKPYHGVRIFLRQPSVDNPIFNEAYFVHLNGPFKAMDEDYDNDGDMDLACISYFPDYERTPTAGFIFLERTSPEILEFRPFGSRSSLQGKWLTADRADLDGDGDIDIILGNGPIMSLHVPDTIKQAWEKQPVTLMLMDNKTY